MRQRSSPLSHNRLGRLKKYCNLATIKLASSVRDSTQLSKKEAFMNKDQFKGSWRQFKGELKKTWGKLTDDDLLEAEGDYDKFLGVVQKRYGDQKEDVEQWTKEWYSRRERDEIIAKKATESRNQL
jgi:Uncharacterized protein conserved in bacteria